MGIYLTPVAATFSDWGGLCIAGARITEVKHKLGQYHLFNLLCAKLLAMRVSMRRFTLLTNGFNMKLEDHSFADALRFMYYNFARIHQILRVTPAIEIGLSTTPWTIADLATLFTTESRSKFKASRHLHVPAL